MAIFLAFIATLVTAWILYKFIFGSWAAFKECAEFWGQPEIVSILFGEFKQDVIAELRFWVWSGGSLAVGYFVYSLLA